MQGHLAAVRGVLTQLQASHKTRRHRDSGRAEYCVGLKGILRLRFRFAFAKRNPRSG
jgi:hypothetical protein